MKIGVEKSGGSRNLGRGGGGGVLGVNLQRGSIHARETKIALKN